MMNYLKRIGVKIASILLLLVMTSTVFAQNSQRKIQSYQLKDKNLQVLTNDGTYRFTFYDENIVQTEFVPTGEKIGNSTAVVMKPKALQVHLTERNDSLFFNSNGVQVVLSKSPFNISYKYKNKNLISEKEGFVKTDSSENIDFLIKKDEVLYGGGERVLGMNRRGYRLKLYNRADYGYGTHSELMNYTMPLVVSSEKYAIHFDNAPIGYLDLDSKKTNTLRYETISGRKVYQVIATDTWQDFTNELTQLTGRQPMLPRWALGNFSSRFGYHSQKEVLHTINQFVKDSIPVDAIILDLYWFGKTLKGEMGNLAFEKDSFPDPEGMIRELKEKGVKTVLITEPFILTTSKRWNEAVSQNVLCLDSLNKPFTYDFYFGHTGLIDVFKPEAAKWFWNIYKALADMGVEGWWGDLGEPEVHPSALLHATGTADELHNIYGHYWAKLVFEGYQKDFPNKRPFILMRAGAVGSQRYGMIPWTGDVSRSWDGLKPQTELSLQMGLQGMAFVHSDLGGFAGANLDNELYTRWLQYGVFQPIFRPHAQEDVPSEPVFRETHTKALAKKAIELRYALMPYIYTMAFQNNQTGLPLMRPLFFDEDNNPNLLTISDTYLWGDAFLVSTITSPGLKEKEVYMPKNSVWFDFYKQKRYVGGKKYRIATEEDHIPVFVRAGSFVPMIKGMQNTSDYSLKNVEIHYYHDLSVKESKGELYNDDGETPMVFEKGEYEFLHFQSKADPSVLKIAVQNQLGTNYKAIDKNVNWVIHNISKKVRKIVVSKKRVDFCYDEKTKTLRFTTELKAGNNKTITIKLAKK